MELYLIQLFIGGVIGCVLGRKELKKIIEDYKANKK